LCKLFEPCPSKVHLFHCVARSNHASNPLRRRWIFMKPHVLALLLVFAIGSEGFAQTPTVAEINALRAQIDALKAEYDKRLQALERQFEALQGQTQPAQPAPTAQTPATAPAPPQTADVPAGAQGAGGPAGQLPVYGGA